MLAVLFELAANSSKDGLTIADARLPDMPVIYANQAFVAMTGYSLAHILGRNCRYMQGPDTHQPELEVLRRAFAEGQACTVTLGNYRQDGSFFWNELSISPICAEGSVVTHFMGVQKDVSERVRLKQHLATAAAALQQTNQNLADRERELAHLNDQLKLFVGYAAHDLRSPLGVISALAKYGNGDRCTTERRKVLLARIEESADSCLELVTSFLDDAALGTGQIELNIANWLLADLLQTCLANLVDLANGQNLLINVNIDDRLAVHVDGQRMIQVFNNLLINAIKYSVPGSQIDIDATTHDGTCTVSITNLVASEPNTLSASNVYRSVGLGLVIVKDVLAAHQTGSLIEQDNSRYTISFALALDRA